MLGCKTCEELELVKFSCSLEASKEDKETRPKEHTPCKPHQRTSGYPSCLDTQTCPPLDKTTFFNNFGDCFEGLGTFDMKPYHITLDPNAEPVIHAPRTVPVHLQDMFRKEVDTMVELGVLIPVSEPTDWVNSIVLSETTNDKGEVTKIRVCLDPCDLNKAIKREHYYTKTIDEVVTQLSGAKFFSVVDAKKRLLACTIRGSQLLPDYIQHPVREISFHPAPLWPRCIARCVPETLRFSTGGPERSHRYCGRYIHIQSYRGRARCKHGKPHDQIQGKGNQIQQRESTV